MPGAFRTCDLNQPFLLPPSLQEWLPENHLARFVAEVSEQLDLSGICAVYERRDGRGAEGYHPLLLTRLLLYAYCVGKTSSRQIEKATYEDVAFRYLAADQHPDHDTIASFRQRHLERLGGLFVQALRLCQEAGLVKLGRVALDGTKIWAQASRRKNVSGKQVAEQEGELARRVEELLAEAERVDGEEEARYGKGKRGEELPEELATAEKRREKLRELKQRMEQQARQQAEELERQKREAGGKPRNEAEKKRWQRAQQRSRWEQQQVNETDMDSRVMKDGSSGAMAQAYNAQAAVDEQAQIIVAADVTRDCNDKGQLAPMAQQIRQNVETAPETLLADAGYFSEEALGSEALRGMDVVVPPDAQRPGRKQQPLARNAPRGPKATAMRERLQDSAGRALYGKRQATVEPVFGQIKERRRFRRFSLRGLEKVRSEWLLICLTHNLLKLHRHRTTPAEGGSTAPPDLFTTRTRTHYSGKIRKNRCRARGGHPQATSAAKTSKRASRCSGLSGLRKTSFRQTRGLSPFSASS
jgi:transposase